MKKGILRIFVLSAVISVFAIGCAKEDEPLPDPGTPDRDKFFGTWHVTSNHTQLTVPQYWDMIITASNSSSDQILIKDFDQQTGTTIYATVNGNSFSIPAQVISGETVQGSGSYSGGNLTFSYTATDTQTDNVNATAKR
jgi:hypothetical protein